MLRDIEYERKSAEIISQKVKDDKAIVVIQSKITSVGGEADQKEVYILVRTKNTWLINELIVTDEEVSEIEMEI